MFEIETLKLNVKKIGHITNSYICYDTQKKEAVVIDPAYDVDKIIEKIEELKLSVLAIVITHGHADHVGALEQLENYTNTAVNVSLDDTELLNGKKDGCFSMFGIKLPNIAKIVKLNNGNKIKVGDYFLEVIFTPGHTKGSICLFERTTNSLFTGDTIFSDCYGRCDLDTGSYEDMKMSLEKIFNKFDDEVQIYPGHGEKAKLGSAKRHIRLLMAIKGE